MVKILVADPQDIIFHGLQHILAEHPDCHISSRVKDRSALLAHLAHERPDIVIIDDACISDFSETDCQQILKDQPELKILILTDHNDGSKSVGMIQAGVHAYLTKNCSKMEILYALQMVRDGQKFFCSTVLDVLTNQSKERHDQKEDTPIFSDRELQVLELIVQDFSTLEIADRLALSHHTIHAHRKKILKKLNVNSPIGIIKQALGLDILRIKDGNLVLREMYKTACD